MGADQSGVADRGVQRRLKAEDVAKLVAGYKAGATARELAAQFGIHRNTVTSHLEREGMPTRPRGLQPGEVDEAADLYHQGLSTVSLARRFGVSGHTMRAALRKAGVRIRPPGHPAHHS